MKRFVFAVILACTVCNAISAGNLSRDELSLKTLYGKLYKASSDSIRSILNDSICQQFNITLKNDSSFEYAFDSLPYLGKVYSTDRKLRIYSWNYISDNGNYRFFSYFQFANHKLIQLSQDQPVYIPEEDGSVEAKKWYGALYYNAVPISYQNEIHYILLGWSHFTDNLNFKVMDVLSVNDTTPTFGLPLFSNNEKVTYRVTLPYSSDHSLSLQYDSKRKLFIFNHLYEEANKNKMMSDESFSCYQLKSGKLVYKEEITFDHHEASLPRTKVEYGLDSNK